MARQLKDLYMCKCLNDLQERAHIRELSANSAKALLTSADKLFAEAEKADLNRDEEKTYLFYYRFVDAIATAQKKEEYLKDKPFYEILLSKPKLNKAFSRLDALSTSLQKRYEIYKDLKATESADKEKEYNDALANKTSRQSITDKTNPKKPKAKVNNRTDTKIINGRDSFSAGDVVSKASLSTLNGIVKENGVSGDELEVENAGITPRELKTMLEQRTKRILLIDCRDKVDFTNNHINHSNCISIPATTLGQGMSAHVIQNTLKEQSPESYMDWYKRGSFDYIILYDWNSSLNNRQPGLNIVYDALTKWDQELKKSTNVLVVQGGMKSMYYAYPNLLTNPQPLVANKLNGNNGSSVSDLVKLDSISYPDLDDTPPKPKPLKPVSASVSESRDGVNDSGGVRYSSANSAVNNIPPRSTLTITSNDGNGVPKNANVGSVGVGAVTVDRSTKPTRLSSATRITNGSTLESSIPVPPEVNTSEEKVPSEKTEVTVKEYSQALDAAIESSKEAVKSEEEIGELRQMLSKQQHYDKDLEQRLKMKELENERLKQLLDKTNEDAAKFKAQYETTLREQKMKHILPRIRTPLEEEEILAKQLEKQRLDDMVTQLRKTKQTSEAYKRIERAEGNVPPAGNVSSDASKFPPIPSNSTGSLPRVTSGIGGTQLPVISNSASSNLPGPLSQPQPQPKPSSGSVSRPGSQDTPGIIRQKLKDENSEPPRSSSLKRSHSHPNIAQSHEDDLGDDLTCGSQVPRVNRGLKPSGQRSNVPEVHTTPRRFARNFEVVSSTEKSNTGLKNLGNTCYMNSIIQCLSHTYKLVDYLRNEDYLKEWHPQRSSTKGEATDELAAAVKQMHSGHRSIALRDLKAMVGKHHFSFKGFDQQDSHEFLTILLDWLNEEMNRIPEKVTLSEQENDGLSDEVAAARAWEDYKRSKNSKISDLFCGQHKSCVTCANCHRQSVTFEPFYVLSVPIPSSGKKCDIQQCIDLYTHEEEVSGWHCVHCKKDVRATKKMDLWRLPPYLIIHFQRFYYDGYWRKRLTEIDFPVDNLNLNQKVLGRNSNNDIDKPPSYDYQLYGVSNHYGTMDSGHYTAYCRIPGPGNWWKFDDQEVFPISSRDVPTAAAYILFYQNRYR